MDILKGIKIVKPYDGPSYFRYNYVTGTWCDCLAINDKNEILFNSNHFLSVANSRIQESGDSLTIPTRIYSRIKNNYNEIVNSKTNYLSISEKCLLFDNSFSPSNAGHDMSCKLKYYLDYYKDANVKFLFFNEGRKLNTNLYFGTLIDESRMIYLNEKTIYKFECLINVHQYNNIGDLNPKNKHVFVKMNKMICDKFEKGRTDINEFKNKNVLLLKSSNMNIIRKHDVFEVSKLTKTMESKGWIVLHPDISDFHTLLYLLNNAKTIVTSDHGGIVCGNQTYFNEKAKIITVAPCKEKNISIIGSKSSACRTYINHLVKKTILVNLNIDSLNCEEKFINLVEQN